MSVGLDVVHLELVLEHCSAEARVNDIPVLSYPEVRMMRESRRFSNSVPIHHWIVPGENRFELAIGLDGSPDEARNPSEYKADVRASASLRIVRYHKGQVTEPEVGAEALRLNWSAASDVREDCSRVKIGKIDFGSAFGMWSWQAAPVLSLDPATLAEAADVLMNVRSALRGGDATALLDLIRVRFDEGIRAFPAGSATESIDRLARWLGELASEPDSVTEFVPGAWSPRLVAGGRMIECLDRDWRACLRVKQSIPLDEHESMEVELPYRVLLARINGLLCVVR